MVVCSTYRSSESGAGEGDAHFWKRVGRVKERETRMGEVELCERTDAGVRRMTGFVRTRNISSGPPSHPPSGDKS